MLIENSLKDKLNIQQKTNTSWMVTTIKAILKTPIKESEKPIFSFRTGMETKMTRGLRYLSFRCKIKALMLREFP